MNLELPDAPHERITALLAEVAKATMELVFQMEERQDVAVSDAVSRASDTWVPTAEAAARLGVTRQTLLRYKARGLLKTARIGRGDRYSTRELDALPEIIQKGPWK